MVASPTPKRFTVDEFADLARLGFFREDDRIELLDGEMIQMAPIGGDHAYVLREVVSRIIAGIADRLTTDLRLDMQSPLRLDDHSEPQPDVMIVRKRPREDTIPDAADALLVMEVADSSLEYDRARKLPRYAAAGIPEAWLFDVAARRIERHSEPYEGFYRQTRMAVGGQELTSTVLPAVVIVADKIFG